MITEDAIYLKDILDLCNGGENFEAIEIGGCRDIVNPDDETDLTAERDDDDPEYFSVFLKYRGGGLDCVADFVLYESAIAYAQTLQKQYGWPIYAMPQWRGALITIEL